MFKSNILDPESLILKSETLGDIPIPHNVVYGNPDSDPKALVASLPKEGGVIVLKPGQYYNFGLGTREHAAICIVGEDPNDRPVINSNVMFGTKSGQVIFIANVEINGNRQFETGIKTQQDYREKYYPCLLITENVYLHDFIGNGVWPSAVSFIEMYRTELARCGGGNIAHNIYTSAHCDSIVLRDSHFHSANVSHPFKNKSRRLLAVGCKFETTNRWQEYLETPALADFDRMFGTTLLDSVGTCVHNIFDCEFNMWSRPRSGNYLFSMNRRGTASWGSDDPPFYVDRSKLTWLPPQEQVLEKDRGRYYPEPVRDTLFWNNDWWDAARAAGSQGRLISRFARNKFRVVHKDYEYTDIYAILNGGSFPKVDTGFVGIYDYPIPDRWWERAVCLVDQSNVFENFRPGHLLAPDMSNRPTVPEHRRGDPWLSPRINVTDENNPIRMKDILPPYSKWSVWRYQAETDENVRIMRENLGYVGETA